MNRFSLKNNFGWTFCVLIFAAFWSGANVESGASSNVAQNGKSGAVVSSSTDSSKKQNEENAASGRQSGRLDAEIFANAVPGSQSFDRSRRGAARRAFEFERSPRFEKVGSSSSFQTSNPRVVERDGFALSYRSIWACQTVSRPLFLLLLTLRN